MLGQNLRILVEFLSVTVMKQGEKAELKVRRTSRACVVVASEHRCLISEANILGAMKLQTQGSSGH